MGRRRRIGWCNGMAGTVAVFVEEVDATGIDGRGVMVEVSNVPMAVLNMRLVETGVVDVTLLKSLEM